MTSTKTTKKSLVRQCLTELGVDVNLGDAKKWFQKNHKLSLADATFYHVRKLMQLEKWQLTRPLAAASAKALATAANELSEFSVVKVVKDVRDLIDKLGKEEAKKLIDLL